MQKALFLSVTALAVVLGLATNVTAQDGDKKEPSREDIFGKSFEDKVEDAVDRGCDWLKKQQGIEKGEDPAVFGQFPPNPPLYGAGEPHRYRFARTAFPIQALCKSGVFADDPAIVKAMEYLRKNYKENGVLRNEAGFVPSTTYEDATVLNAIEAYYTSLLEAKERGLENPKKRVMEDENGKKIPVKRWGTEEKGAKKAKERKKAPIVLSAQDKKIAELAVKSLINRYRKAYGGGGWRYAPSGVGENDPVIECSATQYALMGFLCATRMSIAYDRAFLMDVFHFYRTQQDKDGPEVVRKEKDAEGKDVDKPEGDGGKKKDPNKSTRAYTPGKKDKARGWAYARESKHGSPQQVQADTNAYGSMTAAGVCALIMLRDEMEKDPKMASRWKPVADQCQQMLNDGMAWMVVNWTMKENPKRAMYRYYYYLYMIERVGMLGGIDWIGKHDWYMEGAEILLEQQTKEGGSDGMWDIQNEIDPSDIYNTCYALLFLKRGTAGIDRPKPVFTGGDGEE